MKRSLATPMCIVALWTAFAAPGCVNSAAAATPPAFIDARVSAAGINRISGDNAPLPDPVANAGDPKISGITPDQYPQCMYCSLQPYNTETTATCPTVVGEPQACQSFCHVPQGFNETYATNPPASGNHYPAPESVLGEHAQPVPRGNYLHSMEHGAVILAYNCPQGCDAELNVLRQALSARTGQWVIMTPDPLIKAPRFAAISWSWLYVFDTPELNSLLCFIDQHVLYGRECKDRVCPSLGGVMQSIP